MAITVTVTKRDIFNGNANSSKSCPIARALLEYPRVMRVDVQAQSVTMTMLEGEKRVTDCWKLPPEAQEFIANFDSGKDVEPITFEMTEYAW
jgi:hypothetical protein